MSLIKDTAVLEDLTCYHCGNNCPDDHINIEDKYFCCEGCKTVYEILESNQLCQYYTINSTPGQTPQLNRLDFLDNPEIIAQLIDFQNNTTTKVTFYVPAIHCSSCLWLLENLHRLNPAIQTSRVDFLKKQVSVTFRSEEQGVRSEGQDVKDKERGVKNEYIYSISENTTQPTTTLRQVAELLTSIGYEPLISLNDVVKEQLRPSYRSLLTRIAVAGFCAGNIMIFSFPEYLGLEEVTYKNLFGYLSLILALPAVFYSGWGYFVSVWTSLKARRINLDAPILLAILTAFFRGVYEVLFLDGAGYFDSLSGLIFLLLIGKWFQQRTYDFLSFERDYKAFFPLAVTRLFSSSPKAVGGEESVPVTSLQKGDKILVRNQELIPADGMLYKGIAHIDYSFVTGESNLETHHPGDLLYAGGRQVGESLEIEVLKEVSQSYLTQLWNNETFAKNHQSQLKTFADAVGKYFTIGLLILATVVSVYWYFADSNKILNALTAILIVACPCALALSYPFALGSGLRVFGKNHFYLKNAEVIEQMAQCDTLVFDKTGTLTTAGETMPEFVGTLPLTELQKLFISSLVRHSTHPLSQKIKRLLGELVYLPVADFQEIPGKGVQGTIDQHHIRVGSATFVTADLEKYDQNVASAMVHIEIDGQYLGYFCLNNHYRAGLSDMVHTLENQYELFVLSGDSPAERRNLLQWFDHDSLHFNCQPQQKLDFIKALQAKGKRVIMIGDGLNDAGALQQANVGIAVTENTIHFTPASDAILEANYLHKLPSFLRFSRYGLRVIKISFAISLIYNCIGLSYAITGDLSPIIAAILMPISSTTMVVLATLGMAIGEKKWLSY